MCILQYNTERPAQICFADFVDIDTVIPDLSILNIVETVDQVGDRRFSGAGGADKCDLLAWLCVEFHVVEHDFIVRITEVHTVKDNITAQFLIIDGAVCLVGMLPCPVAGAAGALSKPSVFLFGVDEQDIAVIDLGRLIHELEDTLCTGHSHDDRVELLADLVDRHVEALVESKETCKSAKGKAANAV